jgi:hypothetical protein
MTINHKLLSCKGKNYLWHQQQKDDNDDPDYQPEKMILLVYAPHFSLLKHIIGGLLCWKVALTQSYGMYLKAPNVKSHCFYFPSSSSPASGTIFSRQLMSAT